MGGLLTSVLALDDLFLIHEQVAPDYLGLNENIVFAVYFLLIFSYFLRFLPVALSDNYMVLLSAFFFLGLSLTVDKGLPIEISNVSLQFAVEDGLKLMGIVSWATYFILTSSKAVTLAIVHRSEKRAMISVENQYV